MSRVVGFDEGSILACPSLPHFFLTPLSALKNNNNNNNNNNKERKRHKVLTLPTTIRYFVLFSLGIVHSEYLLLMSNNITLLVLAKGKWVGQIKF